MTFVQVRPDPVARQGDGVKVASHVQGDQRGIVILYPESLNWNFQNFGFTIWRKSNSWLSP